MFKNIGVKLNHLMAQEGISGIKLAQKLGIPASTFKKLRSQEITNPTIATLFPIAQYFSVPIEYFLNNTSQFFVPLIDWRNAAQFYKVPTNKYVDTVRNYKGHAFALRNNQTNIFSENTFLIVDTNSHAKRGDYILVIDSQDFVLLSQHNEEETLGDSKFIGVVSEYQREVVIKNFY